MNAAANPFEFKEIGLVQGSTYAERPHVTYSATMWPDASNSSRETGPFAFPLGVA